MRLLVMAVLSAASLYAQGVAYVVDNARPLVQVVDLGSRQVRTSIPTGNEASEMFILPNNRFAFVSNQLDNNVALLDLASNTRVTTIPTGQAPGSLDATPDGRFVYVAHEGSNDVTVIDTGTRRAVATIPVEATPVQVNISPRGPFAYVVNQDAASISVIDTGRNQVVKTLVVGQRPVQFAISPSLTTAWVVNNGSGTLSVVDLNQNAVTGSVAVGGGPVAVVFSGDGRRAYAILRNVGRVAVVDTQQLRVITQITVGSQPVDMAVTSDSLFAYVSNQGSNTVTILDLSSNTPEGEVAVGRSPFGLQFDPNEDFLYVTNLGSGTVSVIDVNTDTVRSTIAVGGVPVQFTFLNAPTLAEIAPNPAPAGAQVSLRGEGFVAGSTARFATASGTLTPPVTVVPSNTLQLAVPQFSGTSAVVSVVNPDGASSEEITFRLATTPPAVSISAGGVVEGAGFARGAPISGNSIVSVFGAFPGVTSQSAVAFPLPTTLGNATVSFNGAPAPLLYTSAGQINLVAPVRLLALETVQVTVTVGAQTSAPETVGVAPASPGIFVSLDGAGAFLHGADLSLVTAARPARAGEAIVMFLTGLGATNLPPVDGQPAPLDRLAPTALAPTVTVGSTPALVRFSGLAPGFSGLYQINFDVPAGTAAPTALVAVVAGGRTSNSVRLAVGP
ncbi:MAG: beta-propeller fold lactonase family protein [Acidobacteria bacterium]|nr:beta-propeller fold lactonase family protein [Acidobacteriota bacterium]